MADSALVTKTNLAALAEQGYRCVSRLPGTFGEADEVRDAAFATDAWTDVGALSPEKNAAQYKLWETSRSIDGRDCHLVVVHSTSLDKRKQLDALIAKEAKRSSRPPPRRRPFATTAGKMPRRASAVLPSRNTGSSTIPSRRWRSGTTATPAAPARMSSPEWSATSVW